MVDRRIESAAIFDIFAGRPAGRGAHVGVGAPLTQRLPRSGTDRKAIFELRSNRCVKGKRRRR